MSAEPTDEEIRVFSIDMLRLIAGEREREVQAELRRRRLLDLPCDEARIHHRPARPRPKGR
jgi:hypothetical protein